MTQSIKRIKASDGTGNASTPTVTLIRSAGATTLKVNTIAGIYAGAEGFYAIMGTPHTFVDPVTGETITEISEASAVEFQGHINVSDIIIDTIMPGYTDAGSKVGDIVIIRPTTGWANNVSDVLAIAHNDDGTINPPQGTLINGKIVPSIATNNLTLAIKTLAGADPSATDVVIARIGDTTYKITSALSVTLAAGTNWFSKGSSPFGGNATILYAYLGYNATDGVVLGVSSTATGYKYGDFSTTNTDWTYAKISNVAHAASTDVYENIGRFNAILGVSASYNWSLPAAASQVIATQPSRNILQAPVAFSAWRAAAGTVGNAAWSALLCDSKTLDLSNNIDIVTNKGRFTAPVTGLYKFNGAISVNLSGTGSLGVSLFKNGALAKIGGVISGTAFSGSFSTSLVVDGELMLIAGDYVELKTIGGAGYALDVAGAAPNNFFEGHLVRPI